APNHRRKRRREMQLLRLGNYVGVRYNIQSAADDFEIYNVVEDPQERNNLVLRPQKKVSIHRKVAFNRDTIEKMSIRDLEKYMKARVLQLRRPLSTNPRHYDTTLISPVQAEVTQGIKWAFFKGDFPWIPQVATLKPNASGE